MLNKTEANEIDYERRVESKERIGFGTLEIKCLTLGGTFKLNKEFQAGGLASEGP